MAFPSTQLFNLALDYLYRQRTKIHYKYIIDNINDAGGKLVVESLYNDGLIKRLDNSDYYKITEFGRDVVDGGGYQSYLDAKQSHYPETKPMSNTRLDSTLGDEITIINKTHFITAPIPKWQKFLNLQDSPVLNKRISFWASIVTLISFLITLICLI